MTVEKLIIELQKFPPDSIVEAYEGEDIGITLTKDANYGFIPCRGTDEDGETELFKSHE